MINIIGTMILLKFMLNDVPHAALGIDKGNPNPTRKGNSNPTRKGNPNPARRRKLVDFYGSWAVGRAESVCPRGDYECVEREASRLAAQVRARW